MLPYHYIVQGPRYNFCLGGTGKSIGKQSLFVISNACGQIACRAVDTLKNVLLQYRADIEPDVMWKEYLSIFKNSKLEKESNY